MGGINQENKSNKKDRRVISNNEKLDAAIIELTNEHLDEFPFSSRTVVRRIGRNNSHTIITRERNGLKGYYRGRQEDFVRELAQLVATEEQNREEISAVFCRKLGLLIISYRLLFAIDIITRSFRNTEYLVQATKPLINDKQVVGFGEELYQLLQEWHGDQFSGESFWVRYNKRLESLIRRYQITRPSTGLFSPSRPTTLPATGSIFDDNKTNLEDHK